MNFHINIKRELQQQNWELRRAEKTEFIKELRKPIKNTFNQNLLSHEYKTQSHTFHSSKYTLIIYGHSL